MDSNNKPTLLSIIVPVYNEEKTLKQQLDRIEKADFGSGVRREVIVVNDGSTDSSLIILQKSGGSYAKILSHSRNYGKGRAVKSGISLSQGDIIIIQDADLEYDPSDIAVCIEPIIRGRADVVYGSRRLNRSNRKHSSVFFFLGGVLITKAFNFLYGYSLTDEPTCYKAFRSKVLEDIQIDSDGFEWEPELSAKLALKGIDIIEVPVSYNPRPRSQGKKISWIDGLKALWVLIRIRFL